MLIISIKHSPYLRIINTEGRSTEDEEYIVFPKTMDIVNHLWNLHPMETMFSKNSLELSGLISMTNQSFIHWTYMMNTITDEDYTLRFEM